MCFEFINVSAGEYDFTVEARATALGDDISVAVTGGTSPHIGAVSLAVYEPERDSATVSTVTVFSHRDDAVASYFAKEISREIKCTVTVSAGIHVDSASSDDIALLKENSSQCCRLLISKLKALMEE